MAALEKNMNLEFDEVKKLDAQNEKMPASDHWDYIFRKDIFMFPTS